MGKLESVPVAIWISSSSAKWKTDFLYYCLHYVLILVDAGRTRARSYFLVSLLFVYTSPPQRPYSRTHGSRSQNIRTAIHHPQRQLTFSFCHYIIMVSPSRRSARLRGAVPAVEVCKHPARLILNEDLIAKYSRFGEIPDKHLRNSRLWLRALRPQKSALNQPLTPILPTLQHVPYWNQQLLFLTPNLPSKHQMWLSH